MATKYVPKIFAFTLVFAFTTVIAAVTYEGDAFIGLIGKAADSPEVKEIESTYKCDELNNSHFASATMGVELKMKNNLLDEIYLYNASKVYGSYKGKLPNKLTFGMSPATVKATVGKPGVAYNTGYCEFELGSYTLSCWFEGGGLNQVIISAKEGK